MNKFILTIFFALLSITFNNSFSQSVCKISGINNSEELYNYLSISFDSKQMVYAKRKKGDFQYVFYQRTFENNTWSDEKEIAEINSIIKPTYKIGGTCFNYNATVLYYSIDIEDGNGMDIYSIEKIDGHWKNPQKFSDIINSKENESDPSISPDGNTFFFVRDIKGENDFTKDFNCKTIFISEKMLNGKWNKPYRMSRKINLGCEMSPRISADNRTLFFASVRGDDKMGFDIYSTKMVAKGIWSTPNKINKVNNEYSNIYPNISFSGDKIFYINQNNYGKKKEEDILFSSDLSKNQRPGSNLILKGQVSDLYTDKVVNAKIKIINPLTANVISEYKTDKSGNYWFILNSKKKYRIEFSADNYSYDIKQYNVDNLKENKIKKKDVKLYKTISVVLNVFDAEIFQPLDAKIEIINFETNKPVDLEIKKLVKGRFKIELPIGKKYKILASKKKYVPGTLIFDIKKVVQFDEFEKDIELEIGKRKFTVNVINKSTLKPVKVDIHFNNTTRKEKIKIPANSNNNGNYTTKLREGDTYNIKVGPVEGYAFYNTSIDLNKDKSTKLNVKLMSLEENAKLELNNIVFETNSAELTTISYTELDRVVEVLKINTKLKFEISAHTDNVGSDIYNLKLSEKRAKSVVEYLIDKGVSKENLIAKGYGESKPIAPNDTDENKAKNRRVELEILKNE